MASSNSITSIPPKDDWKSFLLFLKFKEDKHKVVFDAVVDSLSSPGQLAFLPGTDEARLNQWHVWLDEHEIKVNDHRTAILSGLQAIHQAPPPVPQGTALHFRNVVPTTVTEHGITQIITDSISKMASLAKASAEKQQPFKFLTNPLPLTFESDNLNLKPEFLYAPQVGSHFDTFKKVLADSYPVRSQDRYSIAVTQSSGAGKTKIIFSLANEFWVNYILFSKISTATTPVGMLLAVLEQAVVSVKKAALPLGLLQKFALFTEFTEGTLRLFKIFLLCYMDALNIFMETVKTENYLLWFKVLQNGGERAVLELFASKVHLANSQSDYFAYESEVKMKCSGRLMIFAYDEVHQFKGELRGRFFHSDYASQKPEEAIALMEKEIAGNSVGRLPTDSFYMLRWASDDILRSNFVTCHILLTTEFSVWDLLRSIANKSPNRKEFASFYQLHVFSYDDLCTVYQFYFGPPTAEAQGELLKLVGRGYFFYVLFMQRTATRLLSKPPQTIKEYTDILHSTLREAVESTKNHMVDRLQRLSELPSAEPYLQLLTFAALMGNGRVTLPATHSRELVSRGIAYLLVENQYFFGEKEVANSEETRRVLRSNKKPKSSDTSSNVKAVQKVEIAEYLMKQYITQRANIPLKPDDDPIFKYAADALDTVGLWAGPGSSDKGKIMEKIVARILMRNTGKPLYELCNAATSFLKASIAHFYSADITVCGEPEDFSDVSSTNPAAQFFSTPHVSRGYFPANAWGPDLACHAHKGKATIPTCGQVKCKKGIMTYASFVKALASLNLSNFYDSTEKKGEAWQTYLATNKPKAYIRIVYNFLGFTSPCIDATNTYNAEVKNANFPILLMQGDKLQLGDHLFNILTNLNQPQQTTLPGGYDLQDLRWIDKK